MFVEDARKQLNGFEIRKVGNLIQGLRESGMNGERNLGLVWKKGLKIGRRKQIIQRTWTKAWGGRGVGKRMCLI